MAQSLSMKLKLVFAFFFLWLSANAQIEENRDLFIQDSLRLISSQFKFTEGPAVDKKGNIFFTDQPNNQIWKYGIDGKLSLFTDQAGRANGTYFDKRGNLIACADEHNELWSLDKNAKPTLLYKNPAGQALNGPNDLWIDAKGGIYFTDPYYQRNYWTRKSPEIVGEKVYYLPKGKKEIIMVEDGLLRPNGIVGTPNGKWLYVADAKGAKTYRYKINADATLSDKQLIINQSSDGITLDNRGNIYVTGKGVTIYSADGKQIGHIKIPENHTANVCFGGKNRNLLFITASKSIYIMPMKVRGVE